MFQVLKLSWGKARLAVLNEISGIEVEVNSKGSFNITIKDIKSGSEIKIKGDIFLMGNSPLDVTYEEAGAEPIRF